MLGWTAEKFTAAKANNRYIRSIFVSHGAMLGWTAENFAAVKANNRYIRSIIVSHRAMLDWTAEKFAFVKANNRCHKEQCLTKQQESLLWLKQIIDKSGRLLRRTKQYLAEKQKSLLFLKQRISCNRHYKFGCIQVPSEEDWKIIRKKTR